MFILFIKLKKTSVKQALIRALKIIYRLLNPGSLTRMLLILHLLLSCWEVL
jgi:hypothetical protein